MSTKGKAESYVELRGSLKMPDAIVGKSAYEIAVANGFDGTEEEWLESLNGKSAYEIAVDNGFKGTEKEWIDSIIGTDGGDRLTTVVKSLAELKAAISNGDTNIALGESFEVDEEITLNANTNFNGCGYTITRMEGYENELIRLGENSRIYDLVINGNRYMMVNPYYLETCELCGAPGSVIENITIQDGNEGIIVYSDNIVRNCKIYNCGGNGIHLSSGHRSRIENNVIVGTNKDERIQERGSNGCIYSCKQNIDVVISNNYLEDGYSGVGSIDVWDNSNIKVIGNTIKNCTRASIITAVKDNDASSDYYMMYIGPKNIIFSENHFINCNDFDIRSIINSTPDIIDCIICNNIFEGTYINMRNVGNITISGNIFKGNIAASYIRAMYCSRLSISNNNMDGVSNDVDYSIYMQESNNIDIKNNYIRAKQIDLHTCNHISFIGNTVHQQYIPNATAFYFVRFTESYNTIVSQNTIVAYTGGLCGYSYMTIQGNHIFLYENAPDVAMYVPEKYNNVVVKDNRRVGGSFRLATNSTNVYEGNDTLLYDDIFQTLTMTLTNITTNVPTNVILGDPFSCVLTASDGYSLPDTITVTNNGENSTLHQDYTYDKTTGKVTIACVKGAVVITATGVAS